MTLKNDKLLESLTQQVALIEIRLTHLDNTSATLGHQLRQILALLSTLSKEK